MFAILEFGIAWPEGRKESHKSHKITKTSRGDIFDTVPLNLTYNSNAARTA